MLYRYKNWPWTTLIKIVSSGKEGIVTLDFFSPTQAVLDLETTFKETETKCVQSEAETRMMSVFTSCPWRSY